MLVPWIFFFFYLKFLCFFPFSVLSYRMLIFFYLFIFKKLFYSFVYVVWRSVSTFFQNFLMCFLKIVVFKLLGIVGKLVVKLSISNMKWSYMIHVLISWTIIFVFYNSNFYTNVDSKKIFYTPLPPFFPTVPPKFSL